eukprot:4309722-Amphidinium_carterae.1
MGPGVFAALKSLAVLPSWSDGARHAPWGQNTFDIPHDVPRIPQHIIWFCPTVLSNIGKGYDKLEETSRSERVSVALQSSGNRCRSILLKCEMLKLWADGEGRGGV